MSESEPVTYLDCCAKPMLVTVKGLYESSHDTEAVERCENCGTHWFYRYHETVNFLSDTDDWTVWYTRLKPDEALSLIIDAEKPDLGFLKRRTSFMKDANGVQQVEGQPAGPGI
mgnify:CR=1 FL=1